MAEESTESNKGKGKIKKPFVLKKKGYYLLETFALLSPRVLKCRFVSKKAATLYIQRRFNGDFDHYLILRSREIRKFRHKYRKAKRRFYSKYAVPNSKILTKQGKKSFRTWIRRELYGKIASVPFSTFCQLCRNSVPWLPTFAKLYIINGIHKKACDSCKERYQIPDSARVIEKYKIPNSSPNS